MIVDSLQLDFLKFSELSLFMLFSLCRAPLSYSSFRFFINIFEFLKQTLMSQVLHVRWTSLWPLWILNSYHYVQACLFLEVDRDKMCSTDNSTQWHNMRNLFLLYVLFTHMWIYQQWLVQEDKIFFSLWLEDRSNNIYCDPNVPGTLRAISKLKSVRYMNLLKKPCNTKWKS